MCCRFHLRKEHLHAILERLGIPTATDFTTRYNLAPGSAIPVIRAPPRATARELAALRWGLTPSWAKTDDPASRLVNARAESLTAKPSFRDALRHRRCLVPASGFYEWAQHGRERLPWLFQLRADQPAGLAALWETWRAPDGTALETCAVITTEPGALMRPIHHRQPLVLAPKNFSAWLDPQIVDPAQLAPLLQPFADDTFTARRVSRYVSSVAHEGPECLASPDRDDSPAGQGESPQLSFDLG